LFHNRRRKEARDRGFQYLSKGDRKSAYEEFRSSARITPAMINNVIKVSISTRNVALLDHIKLIKKLDVG
jgi:hypothetical protein